MSTQELHPLLVAGMEVKAKREAQKAIRAAQQRARDLARNAERKANGTRSNNH